MKVPGRLTLAQAGLSKDGADGAPQMHWKGRNAAPRSDQALVKSRAPPRVRRAGSNFPGVYLTFLGDFRMTADTPRGLIRGVRLPRNDRGTASPSPGSEEGESLSSSGDGDGEGGGASPPKVSLSPYSIVKRKTRGSPGASFRGAGRKPLSALTRAPRTRRPRLPPLSLSLEDPQGVTPWGLSTLCQSTDYVRNRGIQGDFKYWSSTENLKGSCACFEDIEEELALSGS